MATEERRLRIAGIHHITLISGNLERSSAFYRDLLGLRLVEAGVNQDDPNARHFWFGDADGAPGTLVSLFEYPHMERGAVGVGSTHHFAFRVGERGRARGLAALPDLARTSRARRCSTASGSSPSTYVTRTVTSWRSQRTCRASSPAGP